MSQTAAFQMKLLPLIPFLEDDTVTEIVVNQPCEVWLMRAGQRYMERVELSELDLAWAISFSKLIAFSVHQTISHERPLLAATLPHVSDPDTFYRVQIIWPPVVANNTVAICIRKPTVTEMHLSDYEKQQAFCAVNTEKEHGSQLYSDQYLHVLYQEKKWSAFLQCAVKARKNIMISAGTNTGKTTLLNALLKEVPKDERIVTIEDTREIFPLQKNALHLLYARGSRNAHQVTPVDLLESVLRLSPDRILMGELRGEEAYAYLELLNSGHTGAITTIHADTPELMFDRLAQMVMRFSTPFPQAQIVQYARSLIHVVVQCQLDSHGQRFISDIAYHDPLL